MTGIVVMGIHTCGRSLIGRRIALPGARRCLDTARRALRPGGPPPGRAADRAR